MVTLQRLETYRDERGNQVECADDMSGAGPIQITFHGSGNLLRIDSRPRLGKLDVSFDADNGELHIGSGSGKLSVNARVGQDSRIRVGKNTTTTNSVLLSAAEGTSITIGEDVMFASQIQVRTDDAHPIFDVRTGKRVNPSKDIVIGAHVWLAWGVRVLGGAAIGEGSVLGMNSIITAQLPNNVIAVGAPARVVRRDIAWERPHLARVAPFYKPDASTVKKSKYWNLTVDAPASIPRPQRASRLRRGLHRIFHR